ncbi:MAG: aminotransferase class V-fold PLP-dependent enzyme [Bacteroidota bacterium]
MANRRDFIKRGALAAGALAFSPNLTNAVPLLPYNSNDDDESYWQLVRAQFPLSTSKIYLNNGTMGPSPFSVINEVYQDMMDVDTQGRYGGNEDTALKSLASFLNTKDTEISLTRNVTEGINIACWGLPLSKGDEVLLTGHEHVGHATPWLNRAKLDGIVIKTFALGKTAGETLDNLKKALTSKTKVISIPHIPCTIGQVLPVKEICRVAKEKNIYSFLDGAHPPGMLVLDLKDIGCDFYSGCCHKWMMGPKGTGFLYVAEDMRNSLQAYYGGGGFDKGWDMLSNPPELKGYADNGHRYYYGTQNPSLFKGISKAVDFQNQIGRAKIEKRLKTLASYLQDHLIKLSDKVEMLTPTEAISRGGQISFKIKDKDVTKLQTQCNEKFITTRYVAENNINCLRISTHIYNSYAEIDTFLTEVDKFIKM